MPFGVCNAPVAYQRSMDTVLGKLQDNIITIIYSTDKKKFLDVDR